ncbi:hypothetical protein WKA22_003840 [Yersinia enterocolitica]
MLVAPGISENTLLPTAVSICHWYDVPAAVVSSTSPSTSAKPFVTVTITPTFGARLSSVGCTVGSRPVTGAVRAVAALAMETPNATGVIVAVISTAMMVF